ncbi:MAG TPA: hypothetical protein VGH98_04680 [Gemmatimonadaceae bacterium]|jgi:hypothetical protein
MTGRVFFAAMLAWLPLRGIHGQLDSAAIIRTVWGAATLPVKRVTWLWTPVSSFSPELRAALVRAGVPASERRPAGDDTVVFQFTRWRPDSAGVIVQLVSDWTEVIGSGARRCRVGSGNTEQFLVRQGEGALLVERIGPIIHGDKICAPLR